MTFALWVVFGWVLSASLAVIGVFLFGSTLLLNAVGYYKLSGLYLSLLLPVYALVVSILVKSTEAIPEEPEYFDTRLIILSASILPLVIFRYQQRYLLFLGLSFSFFSLIGYDFVHSLFGVGYYQAGHNSTNYAFIRLLFIIIYLLLVLAFLYYKFILEKAEVGLVNGNQQLSRLYTELGRRHEEIQAQAEKLQVSQQQLQEANQLIEQQKALLQAENKQLHRHLLEKNRILEDNNRELHNRLEELQHFSYTISHNLRGPVASLLGLTNLFKPDGIDVHNKELMMHARTAAQSLDGVIRDLSQVLQLREGKVVTETMDITHLMQTVLVSLRQEKEACQAEIYQQLEEKEITGVKSYLHSILYNLLSNALKYRSADRGCIVTISSRQKDGGILIEVADNGTGIDLEQYGHQIFKMYKRFHENREGRGLGLYLLKVQAEVMGGYVEVHSQPGIGSTFSVWLPQQAS